MTSETPNIFQAIAQYEIPDQCPAALAKIGDK